MNTMTINGYQAVISFDPEIQMFRGEFVGLNGGVTHLTGDAADSPISITDTYATALTFVGYRF